MKSKEIIRKLQELDPSGEIEVTGWTGAIHCLDIIPGYWDGPCYYFPESESFPEKMIISDKMDSKILIREISLEDYIYNVDGDLNRVVIDTHNPDGLNKLCEKYSREAKKVEKQLDDAAFKDFMQKFIIEKLEVVCPDKSKSDKHHQQYWYKDDKQLDKLNQGECSIVLKSGFFKKIELDNLIKYVLIGTK
jgi:hypothetical protein